MEKLYNTPVITVEELTKCDVLCASNEINPSVFDNSALSGSESGAQGLGGMSNVI